MRDPIEWNRGVPHRDRKTRSSCANCAVVEQPGLENTGDKPVLDGDRTGVAIAADESGDPALCADSSVARAWVGNDGAALVSTTSIMPSWASLSAASSADRLGRTPRCAQEMVPADPALAGTRYDQPLPRNDRADQVGAVSPFRDREIPWRGWNHQCDRRQGERALRKRSVAFGRYARGRGWSTEETAEALGLSPRTLARWDHGWKLDRLAAHRRGRPPQIASVERQAEITGFLTRHGPSVSLASLAAEYPDVARAELAGLRSEYCTEWRQDHAQEQHRLEWLCPGSVWAMDFTHPPHLIDGVFAAILNVLDLASRQQLLWLAVAREDAATVAEALADLFAEHGPPLVMKCDNGPAFRAHLTKRLLLSRQVFTLYSPPYYARYNGGCERANRTLKELTGHVADRAGRRDFWQSDDLLVARLTANRLTRPWGTKGPTPEESWEARDTWSLDKRENMWQHLSSEIATVMDQRMIDPTVALSHYIRTEIERIAAQPVLEQLGLLRITRRRITPAF